ncbi:MAG: DUF1634 domain-containing protein [Deltaproteobacteria bacterium]|nr:DUF1634 domain-containing protein [Deltaproteobacteria bacterium]
MNAQNDSDLQPTPEQVTYANLLLFGAWGGIFLMLVTYIIYVSGVLPAHVDMAVVAQHWGEGVHEYLQATNSPHGWGWVALLGHGDFLNFVGMALLAAMTIICYLVLIRGYLRQKDHVYAVIAVLEVLVLSIAASGILGTGGH